VADSSTNTHSRAFSTNAQTSPKPFEPCYRTELAVYSTNPAQSCKRLDCVFIEKVLATRPFFEPRFVTEIQTWGYQEGNLRYAQPLYKTEVGTYCTPKLTSTARVTLPYITLASPAQHLPVIEQVRFCASTRPLPLERNVDTGFLSPRCQSSLSVVHHTSMRSSVSTVYKQVLTAILCVT